jgi:SNF2 family DNA or RNA helicase
MAVLPGGLAAPLSARGGTATHRPAFLLIILYYSHTLGSSFCSFNFPRRRWTCLVLDEMQYVKDFASSMWHPLRTLHASFRLVLTNSSLPKNPGELWAIFEFLFPRLFNGSKDFKKWLTHPFASLAKDSQDHNDKILQRLLKILRCFQVDAMFRQTLNGN